MSNDIDMWNDLEDLIKLKGKCEEYDFLWDCYMSKFIDFDDDKAEVFKQDFIDKFGYWGNYY
jgi:hypothetical protein